MAARTINFTLNGEPVSAEIANHHTLLEVVRNEFSLYGARESCGQGLCGCCTLIVNGTAVSGCLFLAAFADGAAFSRPLKGGGSGRGSRAARTASQRTPTLTLPLAGGGNPLVATRLLSRLRVPEERRCKHRPSFVSERAVRLGAQRAQHGFRVERQLGEAHADRVVDAAAAIWH